MQTEMAVIKSGGRQYLVRPGSEFLLEKLDSEVGLRVDFKEVLLWVDKKGQVQVGQPLLNDVRVQGEVVEQVRRAKVQGVRYYNKRHMRKYGHRQELSRVRIIGFSVSEKSKSAN